MIYNKYKIIYNKYKIIHNKYKIRDLTLTAVTVNPALVLPMPVVSTERGITLDAYLRN